MTWISFYDIDPESQTIIRTFVNSGKIYCLLDQINGRLIEANRVTSQLLSDFLTSFFQ